MVTQENAPASVPKELVDIIITQFYRVYNDLGYGFLERVYKNAMYFALTDLGLKCEVEKNVKVYHDGRVVGDYFADLLVEDCIILELKTCENIDPAHEVQLINYLKAKEIEVGYLLNFGRKATFKRKVYSNQRKFYNTKKDLREFAFFVQFAFKQDSWTNFKHLHPPVFRFPLRTWTQTRLSRRAS